MFHCFPNLEHYKHLNKEAETSASYGRKLETKVRIYILIIVLSNLEQYQHLNEEASYTRKLRFFGQNMMVKSGVFLLIRLK